MTHYNLEVAIQTRKRQRGKEYFDKILIALVSVLMIAFGIYWCMQ